MSLSKSGFRCFLAVSIVFALSACSDQAMGRGNSNTSLDSCDSSQIQYPYEAIAWSFSDITVGQTTENELLSRLGEPSQVFPWPPSGGPVLACIYRYASLDGRPSFWLANNKVIAIELTRVSEKFVVADLPTTQEEAKVIYGSPDIVGWSRRARYRSVVWASKGILADIWIQGDYPIDGVILFAPMSQEDFANSVWVRLILDFDPTMGTDNVDGRPRDPFDWN